MPHQQPRREERYNHGRTRVEGPPPKPDQRIEALYAWIGMHADGSEGLLSADMDVGLSGGRRHLPLMSSKRELAEGLEPYARQIQRDAMHQKSRLVKIELRTYVLAQI